MIKKITKIYRLPKGGFGLVEIVVGAALFTSILLGLTLISRFTLDSSRTYVRSVQAGLLLEEGAEAVRILRDTGWTPNIAPQPLATDLYLTLSSGSWSLTSTASPLIDGIFTRTIQFNSVNRDSATDDIVTSGGSLDTDTVLVTIDVSWSDRSTHDTSVDFYLTNLFDD